MFYVVYEKITNIYNHLIILLHYYNSFYYIIKYTDLRLSIKCI